ncbi:lantibiotic dehydratase [Sphingobacterium detergens]|uniref:Thiopeptide-type bacteriocin biosynthesis protein n=1 Tax=Sphingobacterium detergens TaxID=1145106 RepID=A0A420ART0_SPHD1|nr:lantibiotic dehydratase [Sphingobacterium detergens]RKE47166.1 thiopeptide-type bacteriocin biosynthesis protein [Sphingobacterium detergens]
MNLKIYPHAVIRIPGISYHNDLETSWKELKAMIKDSSPEFYALIENLDLSEIKNTDKRIQQTIWKYFNRARYRATPFGEFATTGCVQLAEQTEAKPIRYSGRIVHEFVDWGELGTVDHSALQKESFFQSNSSYYVVADEIRYLRRDGEGFEIAAIALDPLIHDVLTFTENLKSYAELSIFLKSRISDPIELQGFLHDLLELQLLLSSLNANIIGDDYFQRLAVSASSNQVRYKIAESTLDHDHCDINLFKHLPQAAILLSRLSPVGQPADLKTFAERFFAKFEQANIPLMVALDPEIGVGYAFSEKPSGLEDDQIENLTKQPKNKNASADLRHQGFMEFLKEISMKNIVNLEDLPVNSRSENTIPNTLGAICNIIDGNIWLDYLGGATANSLLGRFTTAVGSVERICDQLFDIEKNANPDVLFFDIGYMAEMKVDNINRRKQIYDAQVNILNYDPKNISIPISDIFICVKNGKVILFSKRLNKRLVPRMASAYNFKRSTLPLFRMLCDMMFEEVQADLMFRPEALLLEQNFYPRVSFKNIVISPATWRITSKSLQGNPLGKLKEIIRNSKIPRFVKTGLADQTLLFDTNSLKDLQILSDIIGKQDQIFLKESPLPHKHIVEDQQGNPYLAQFIICLHHDKPLLAPFSPLINNGEIYKQWLAPCKEWLYYEIYMSHFRADEILQRKIAPFLATVSADIASWFFIRYSDGGDHIRLRLKMIDARDSVNLNEKLLEVLDPEFEAGIISDLKICSYKKEIHRYGIENMESVERHFYVDSEFAFQTLPLNLSHNAKYTYCLQMLLQLYENQIMGRDDFEAMIEKIVSALSREHNIYPEKFKILNSIYKQVDYSNEILIGDEINNTYDLLVTSFFKTIANCRKASRKILLADLMHMHINRMFHSNQRTHELVVFYLLQKELKKRKFQHRNESAGNIKELITIETQRNFFLVGPADIEGNASFHPNCIA